MRKICDLDVKLYRCVCADIRTAEVIITEERIRHIRERHPDDFERYSSCMAGMVEDPQYILEDAFPNTAVILQEFVQGGEHFRLVMKIAVTADGPDKKNSVITFMKISEKKFRKYLRNKKILYKRE